MNARTALVLLLLFANRAGAGQIDKPKLQKLAELPTIRVVAGIGFSTTYGFVFNDEKPDPAAEIAHLRKQLQGNAGDIDRYQRLGLLFAKMDQNKKSEDAYAKAIALCRRQVREHPQDKRWLAQLGDVLVDADQGEEGEKLLRRVVKEAPEEWRGWLALGRRVDTLSLQAVLGEERFTYGFANEKMIVPALLKKKPSPRQIAEMRRLHTEARTCYDRAVRLAPKQTKPYLWRIASAWGHGGIEAGLGLARGDKVHFLKAMLTLEAAADMRQIARLSPDDPRAIGMATFVEILACLLHGKIDLPDESSARIWGAGRPLLKLLPQKSQDFVHWSLDRLRQLATKEDKRTAAVAYEMLASTLLFLHSWDKDHEGKSYFPLPDAKDEKERKIAKIRNLLRRAVDLDPSRERAWELLTPLLLGEGRKEEAAAVAHLRIEKKDNAHNRFVLAKVYAKQEQFDKAAEELRIGLKGEPKDLDCRLGLIATLLKRSDAASRKEAGEQLDAVQSRMKTEKSASRGTSYLLLRGIHAALNECPKKAKELFVRVLQRDKGNTSAARAFAALGEPLTPADEPMAAHYLEALGGRLEREDKRPGSPIVKIHLTEEKFTNDDLFILTAFSRLPSLRIYSDTITEEGLDHLKSLTSLRELDLAYVKLTDNDLPRLKSLTNLRVLSLDGQHLTDVGLSHLEAFAKLERLWIDNSDFNTSIADKGLAHLRKLPQLRSVTLIDCVTDKGLAHLAALPRLRELTIISSKITDKGMAHLERCTELREFFLSGTEISDAGAAHLKGLRHLEKLVLSDTRITDAGLVHLRGLKNLRKLVLSNLDPFEGAGEMLKKLSWVPVEETEKKPVKPRITDEGLKQLKGLTNLEELNLMGHPISDAGLAQLKNLTNLRCLLLSSSKVTDAGLRHLEHLTKLERLFLDRGSITDAGLTHLCGLKRLKFVSLDGTKVTAKGIADLRKALPRLEVSR